MKINFIMIRTEIGCQCAHKSITNQNILKLMGRLQAISLFSPYIYIYNHIFAKMKTLNNCCKSLRICNIMIGIYVC